MSDFYIITMSPTSDLSESDELTDQLDKALDWIQPFPNTFIIQTTSDSHKWYRRLKPVLRNNLWFIVEIDLNERKGFLPKWAWDWIKNKGY